MRKFFYLLLAITVITSFTTSCENKPKDENTFKLSLNITNGDDVMVILSKRKDGEMIPKDSVMLLNGKGILNGKIDSPTFYYLMLKDTRIYVPVFVEAGDIVINLDMNDPRKPLISGSLAQEAFDAFNDSVDVFDQQASLLYKQYSEASAKKDLVQMAEIDKKYNDIDNKKKEYMIDYALKNNDNVVTAFLVFSNSYKFELDDLERISVGFDSSIDSNEYVINLRKYVSTLQKSSVGQPFIDFTLNNPEGTPVPLSSITNGNYVLVDFWASWCSPCRAENPNVVLAYNTFHDKGFDVFGVSFDRNYDKWVEAIAADSLTWTHVSDLKFWNNAAGKLYGIQSIPQNILIDPNGIIIEKNLRGKALQTKLAELLN